MKQYSVVYKITNLANNKVYIGETQDYRHRWYSHRKYLHEGTHSNKHLQEEYKLYGPLRFHYEVLEYLSLDKLRSKESHYINLYKSDSKEKGYNKFNPKNRVERIVTPVTPDPEPPKAREVWYKPEEISRMLGIEVVTLKAIAKNREVTHLKFGQTYRFTKESIEEWMQQKQVNP